MDIYTASAAAASGRPAREVEMKLKAAILQTKVYTEKEKNILQLERILAAGQTEGADLVTLPEMFACPYETGNFPMYAEAEGGPSWQALSSLAKQHSIYLSAGSMPELVETVSGRRVYNTAYVFGPDGQQIGKHRKAHLFDINVEGGQSFKESDTLSAGEKIGCFDISGDSPPDGAGRGEDHPGAGGL